jgi:hypothetical protein
MAVAFAAYIEHPAAFKIWEATLRPIIFRGPKLKSMIAESIVDGEVVTPAGVILPDRTAVRFKKDRIKRTISRIVRGLLWYHYKIKLASDAVFEIHKDRPLNGRIADLINSRSQLSWVGDDIFRYRHSLVDGDPDGSIWCFQFYGCTEFLTLVLGKAFTELNPDPIPKLPFS